MEYGEISVTRLSSDDVFYNPERYNTNNLWADEKRPRPTDYEATLARSRTNRWVDLIHTSVPVGRMTLGSDATRWMLKAAAIGMITGKFSGIYQDELEDTVEKYGTLFPVPPVSGWFVRTERVSLKCGIHGPGPYFDLRSVLESIVTSSQGHECINLSDDLDNFTVYFFDWVNIFDEFRVFVYNNRITAISTQHYSAVDEWLSRMTDEQIKVTVADRICRYFEGSPQIYCRSKLHNGYCFDSVS